MVSHGIRSKFKDGPPPPRSYKNTFTFKANEAECTERLRVYRDLGAVRQVKPPAPGGYLQPLHGVIKPGKKARVCVDLSRNFNDFLVDEPFQYSSVKSAVDLAVECPTDAFFVKLDISACFLSFPLHPADYKFFVVEAGGDFYQFLCMMFGLKSAPRIATLLLDIVSSAIADLGIAHVRYLDDFFIVGSTADRAWASAHAAAEVIRDFGLALAPDKVEGPLQRIEYLGIVLDSVQQTLSISPARQEELTMLLSEFQRRRWTSRRRLQSLLGKLAFAATVLPGARPFTRRIIDTLVDHPQGRVALDGAFRADIKFWLAHMATWNGRAKWRPTTSTPLVFASDASTSGFAYGLEACSPEAALGLPPHMRPGIVRCGTWSASAGDAARQATSSAIQYGEFFCPVAAVTEYGPLLANSHVVFACDNEADTFVINRHKTRDPGLSSLLRALCEAATRHNFSFSAVHRAGDKNVLMDWASRPALHQYRSDPALVPLPAAGLRVGELRYPPLLRASSFVFVNSRCVTIDDSKSTARWASSSSGW
jgi:hypothetical protein